MKALTEILALCTATYLGNCYVEYLGFSLSIGVQEEVFGRDSAMARVERVLKLAEDKPYDPGRFFFAGVEAAALQYKQEHKD